MMKQLANERGSVDTLLISMMVIPVLLFVSFAGVPFFVYMMKGNHLNVVANHTLKEAEAVGYVSADIAQASAFRLSSLGIEPVTIDGRTYPSFEGSTSTKVLQDDGDPTVVVILTYPAPGVTRLLNMLGGRGGAEDGEGFYRVVLYGKSEAFE